MNWVQCTGYGRRLALVLLALVSLGACAPGGDGQDANLYGQDVDQAVLQGYAQYGERHILLIGDSLTMYNPITELCGWPVIKAGYSGAKWATVAARPIWAQIRSRIVVVQLGTNNALKGPGLTVDDMRPFLDRLNAGQLIVETIPPFFDPAYPMDYLAGIQEAQTQLGEQTIDSRTIMNDPTLYLDGIHWNAQGYVVENGLLNQEVCGWVS